MIRRVLIRYQIYNDDSLVCQIQGSLYILQGKNHGMNIDLSHCNALSQYITIVL
jgi:hypothetical protein